MSAGWQDSNAEPSGHFTRTISRPSTFCGRMAVTFAQSVAGNSFFGAAQVRKWETVSRAS